MQPLQLTKKYKTYPEYRESGVEWLQQVPSHWPVFKVRKLISQLESGVWGDDPLENQNDYKCLRVADFDYDRLTHFKVETIRNISNLSKKKILKKGDILIEKSGGGEKSPVGRAIIFNSDELMVCANFIEIVRVNKTVLPEFLNFQLYAAYFSRLNLKSIKQNTGIQNLDLYSYFSELFVTPDIGEQKNIVNFLNRQLYLIDKIIEKKQKQIDILKEKRTAVINEAVTKGLDSNAEMIAGGIEWIGVIPKGWDIEKLKRVSEVNKETLSETTDPSYSFKYFDIGSIEEDEIQKIDDEITFGNAPSRARRVINSGDSIIATVRTYLKAIAYFDKVEDRTIASTGFAVLTPTNKVEKKYLYYYLRSDRFINQVIIRSKGVSYPAITPFDLANLEIILPTKKEQKEIIVYLDKKTKAILKVIEQIEVSIKLLQEFKSSLISNVVTGKVKI